MTKTPALSLVLCLAAACAGPRQRHVPQPQASYETEPAPQPAEPQPAEPQPAEPQPEEPQPEAEPTPDPEPAPAPDPIPATVVARVSVEDVTVDGRRPPDFYARMVRDAVGPPLEQVLECYRGRLAEDSSITGDLRLRLWVSSRQVIRATPEDELADADLQECAVTRIRTLRLPSSAPTAGASVRFTLRFATGPRTVAPADGVVLTEVESTVDVAPGP